MPHMGGANVYTRKLTMAITALGMAFAALLVLCWAAPALADVSSAPLAGAAQDGKYRQLEGTVYFSRSDDARFCVSDGAESGLVMANVPVDLAEVCKVDLDAYGLGEYNMYATDPDAGYEYECTLLQLLVYVAERYSSEGADGMQVTDAPGSAYLKRYWGDDENMLYYVNGRFPLEAPGRGATCDTITLADGDVVEMAHYGNWRFWTDPAAGFHFFADASDRPVTEYRLLAGETLEGRLVRSANDLGTGSESRITPEGGWDVRWGARYGSQAPDAGFGGSVETAADGTFAIAFDEPGTYWVWVDGGVGRDGSAIVSSPAAAIVVVRGDISGARVSAAPQVYSGRALTPEPSVSLAGKTLVRGVDYKASYGNNVNAGQATITVRGIGGYEGEATGRFSISKAPNGLSVKAAKKAFSAKRGEKTVFVAKRAFKVSGNVSGGKISYKLAKVPKKAKKHVKLSKAGKLTVKKGCPKGTYRIKVKAVQAATANYEGKVIKSVAVKLRVR